MKFRIDFVSIAKAPTPFVEMDEDKIETVVTRIKDAIFKENNYFNVYTPDFSSFHSFNLREYSAITIREVKLGSSHQKPTLLVVGRGAQNSIKFHIQPKENLKDLWTKVHEATIGNQLIRIDDAVDNFIVLVIPANYQLLEFKTNGLV